MGNERKIVGIRPTGGDRSGLPAEGLVDAVIAPAEVADDASTGGFGAAGTVAPADHDNAGWSGTDSSYDLPDDVFAPTAQSTFPWVGLVFAAAAATWGAFLGWSQTNAFTQMPALGQWPTLAVAFSAPLALIALCILLAERGSERSQRRHLRLLGALRTEQTQLAHRLGVIDGLWRDVQSALGARAAALQDEAARASAQVSDATRSIDGQMQRAAAQSAIISEQGERAQRAMEALLVALPKIEEVAARATESMRETGQLAYQYGGQLEAQIATIAHETGEAQRALAEAQAQLSGEILSLRDSVSAVEDRTTHVTEAVGRAIDEQRAAAMAAVTGLHSELDTAAGAGESIRATIESAKLAGGAAAAVLIETATEMDGRLQHIEARFADRAKAMGERLTKLDTEMTNLDLSSETATQSAEQFVARVDALVATLAAIRTEADANLPAALERLESLVAASQAKIEQLPDALGASGEAIDALLQAGQEIHRQMTAQCSVVAEMSERTRHALADHDNLLSAMAERAEGLSQRLRTISEDDAVRADNAVAAIDATANRVIETSVEQLHRSLGAAIDSATGDVLRDRLEHVVAASDQAVSAASAASDRLMRELITIADSSAALEARAQQVASMVDAGDRQSLSRQLETLVEALQSHAVDLTRLVDGEVADQAWESYLKGDRSIFARRALRLLTNAQAKDLRTRYEQDSELRLMVNRYVQDFETMLRLTMDRREGSAIAVTLLSSDIGKIYVALAQAIERLRS